MMQQLQVMKIFQVSAVDETEIKAGFQHFKLELFM